MNVGSREPGGSGWTDGASTSTPTCARPSTAAWRTWSSPSP